MWDYEDDDDVEMTLGETIVAYALMTLIVGGFIALGIYEHLHPHSI